MSILNINFDDLIIDLMPIELRTSEHLEWLKTIGEPIKTIDTTARSIYSSYTYDIQHTSQVTSLEHYLNNYFSLPYPVAIPNSIYITDGKWLDEAYIFISGDDANSDLNNFGTVDPSDPYNGQLYSFADSESITPSFDTVYLYSSIGLESDTLDFHINIESSFDSVENRDKINKIVNEYKKVGKTFNIVTY